MFPIKFLRVIRHSSALLAGIGVVALAATSGLASSGTVVGSVKVVQGQGSLPHIATLVFSGTSGEHESHTDEYGHYKVSLPAPDTYRVTMLFANCRLSRAAFRLSPGEKLEFHFVGVLCPTWEPQGENLSDYLVDNAQRLPGTERPKPPPPKIPTLCSPEDELPVWYREQRFASNRSNHRPEVVISYGRCEENPKLVTYFSLDPSLLPHSLPRPAGLLLPVAITTETYTVRADKVTRPGRGFTFYASGNVTVEDGRGHLTRAESAMLSFIKGQPIITLTPGF